MARKFSAFTNSPTRAATDTLVGLDVSAAAAAQNSYWTLNTLFSQISDNTTDGSIRWGGVAAPAVSAAGKGAIYFDSTANAFRVSQNAGAYAGLILGTIANTQVAVGSAAGTVTGSSAFTFASGVAAIQGTTNPGVTITGTAATESGITVNQSVSGTAADAFHSFQTSSTTVVWRLTTAGFTPTGLIKANQLDMFGAAGTVEMLFRLADASTRFVFGVNNVEAASINATSTLGLVLGVASTLTGRVRMYNSAGATYTQLSAGNAAASLNYILPTTSPSSGYVLSASAPSGSDVTLSWAAAASAASLTATQVGFGDGTNMLSGSADFTYTTAAGQLLINKTVNGSMYLAVTNGSNGAAAQARFAATADVAFTGMIAYSSGFTTSGLRVANSSVIDMDGPAGSIFIGNASGSFRWGLGTTEYARMTSTVYTLYGPTTGSVTGLSVTSAAAGSGVTIGVTSSGANESLILVPKGNSSVDIRNGTTPQILNIFNTYTDAGNYESFQFGIISNVATISNRTVSGTGSSNRAMAIDAGGTLDIRAGGGAAVILYNGTTSTAFFRASGVFNLAPSGTETVGFTPSAAVLRLTNASTGAGGLLIGTSTDTGLAGALTVSASILRGGTANFSFGAADAATPVAQTLSVQNVVGGTPDTAGANWTRIGSRSTGSQNGGSHIWQVSPLSGAGSTQNALINGLVLTGGGQLYGAALHNNVGAVAGTTNQYIASGTYTPTVTAVTNCTATSSGVCQWIRVGNVVTVSGVVAVDPTTAATFTSVGISLPIASNFATNASECAGVAANANVQGYSGAITADFTNDRAQLDFTTGADVANQGWSFTFTYVVL